MAACLTLGALMLGACGGGRESGGVKNMLPIEYTPSSYDKGTADSKVVLSVPGKTVSTGDEITATVKISSKTKFEEGYESVYYIVDWGDGTWAYQGPGLQSASKQSSVAVPHTYKKAGDYKVSATAVAMQNSETNLGWTETKTIKVEGKDYEPDTMIQNVSPISSPAYDKEHGAEKIADGKPTYFKSQASKDIDDELYAGYLFDENYTLDTIEVKIPAEADIFPSNIAVEYTSDFGESWQSLPKYYYLYDYSVGRFNPIMRFPNPKGATLVLNLDGIVANGIRLTQKLSSMNLSELDKEKCLMIEEMRVYGSLRTLLYTSKGHTFDADLNNMWTIFGTAKTEPVVLGSIMGETQNASPFRTGSAMIGSTEWMEWVGLKFNFTDYEKVNDTYLDLLVRIRTGSDTWSNDDGYVWATPDSPLHLNATFGCHYSLNPIYILAIRNYLLQCNRQGKFNDDGTEFTEFLNLTNTQGQSIQYKVDKAMSYMMNTLSGKTGIMTINDPAKDGTTSGMSSNYWDVHKTFGYMSAYENAYFYASLLAYADIYDFKADNYAKNGQSAEAEKARDVAEEYRGYAEVTREKYNTLFWDEAKGRYIGGINADGERLGLLKGGRGGLGNWHFKSATNQAPRYAQPGEEGDEGAFVLELKVLADVGLVGFPNAGKSTLLSVVSAAKPKIANYAFTTLEPNLGIVECRDGKSFVMADIPGIIEGAHEGRGLGLRFLRHIERNSVLLFMVPADADDIRREYEILLGELTQYNPELLDKQRLLAVTKSDMLDEQLIAEMRTHLPEGIPALFISSVTGYNIPQLKDLLWEALHK